MELHRSNLQFRLFEGALSPYIRDIRLKPEKGMIAARRTKMREIRESGEGSAADGLT